MSDLSAPRQRRNAVAAFAIAAIALALAGAMRNARQESGAAIEMPPAADVAATDLAGVQTLVSAHSGVATPPAEPAPPSF